jgi:hypothetical protein
MNKSKLRYNINIRLRLPLVPLVFLGIVIVKQEIQPFIKTIIRYYLFIEQTSLLFYIKEEEEKFYTLIFPN